MNPPQAQAPLPCTLSADVLFQFTPVHPFLLILRMCCLFVLFCYFYQNHFRADSAKILMIQLCFMWFCAVFVNFVNFSVLSYCVFDYFLFLFACVVDFCELFLFCLFVPVVEKFYIIKNYSLFEFYLLFDYFCTVLCCLFILFIFFFVWRKDVYLSDNPFWRYLARYLTLDQQWRFIGFRDYLIDFTNDNQIFSIIVWSTMFMLNFEGFNQCSFYLQCFIFFFGFYVYGWTYLAFHEYQIMICVLALASSLILPRLNLFFFFLFLYLDYSYHSSLVVPCSSRIVRQRAIVGTHRWSSRERGRNGYDYDHCVVITNSHDDQNYDIVRRRNVRFFHKLKGVTTVQFSETSTLIFHFPLIDVSVREFIEFLRKRVVDRKTYQLYARINQDNKYEYMRLFGYKFDVRTATLFPESSQSYYSWFFTVFCSPVYEEVIKHFTGPLLPFIEIGAKYRRGNLETDFVPLIPFFMHMTLLYFFPEATFIRILIHSLYNFVMEASNYSATFPLWYLVDSSIFGKVRQSTLHALTMEDSLASVWKPLTFDDYSNYLMLRQTDPLLTLKEYFSSSLEEEEIVDVAKLEVELPNKTLSDQILKNALSGKEIQMVFKPSFGDNLPINFDFLTHSFTLETLLESDEIALIANIINICLAVGRCEFDAAFLCIVSGKWIGRFYRYFKFLKATTSEGMAEEIKSFLKSFSPEVKTDIVFTSSEAADKLISRFLKFFPENFRASPGLKHLIVLFTAILSALWFKDFVHFEKCFETIIFKPMEITELNIIDAFLAVIEGFVNVFSSGRWTDFFQEPEHIKLRNAITDYLMKDPQRIEEYEEYIAKTGPLLTKINKSTDTFAQTQVRSIMAKHVTMTTLFERVADIYKGCVLLFLVGSPGTGKTDGTEHAIDVFFSATGKPRPDKSRIGELKLLTKYPAEGIPHNAEVFIINELNSDNTQDTKSDRIPLDVTLQMLCEVRMGPSFKEAAIGNKGRSFNHIKLVVISCNPMSFVFEGETEKLKRRFDECCVVVNQELVEKDSNGEFKVLKYDHMDKKFNNIAPLIHYRLMRAHTDAKHLVFQADTRAKWADSIEMTQYFQDFVRTKDARVRVQKALYSNKCSCGITKSRHFRNGQFIALSDMRCFSDGCLCGEEHKETPTGPDCRPYECPPPPQQRECCDCGISMDYHRDCYPNLHWSNSRWLQKFIREKEEKDRALLQSTFTCSDEEMLYDFPTFALDSNGRRLEEKEAELILKAKIRVRVEELIAIIRKEQNVDEYVIKDQLRKGLRNFFPMKDIDAEINRIEGLIRQSKALDRRLEIQLTSLFLSSEFSWFVIIFFFMHVLWLDRCLYFYRVIRISIRDTLSFTKEVKRLSKDFDTTMIAVRASIKDLTDEKDFMLKQVQKYLGIFVLVSGGAVTISMATIAIKYFLTPKSPSLSHTSLTKVLTRENIEAESLEMKSIKTEVNFPPEIMDKWGKTATFIPTAILGKQGVSPNQLSERLRSNTYLFTCSYNTSEGSQRVQGYMLKISPQFFLMNRHYFNGWAEAKFELFRFTDLTTKIDNFCLSSTSFTPVEHDVNGKLVETDLVLINPYVQVTGKDMIDFFPTKVEYNQCPGFVLGESEELSNVSFQKAIMEQFGLQHVWIIPGLGAKGNCGKAVICKTNTTSFIGGIISFMSNPDNTLPGTEFQGGNVVYREDLQRAMNKFGVPIVKDIVYTAFNYSPLSLNSDLRNVASPFLIPVGTLPGKNSSFKTSFYPSKFHPWTHRRCDKEYSVPLYTRKVVDGEFCSVTNNTFTVQPKDEIYNQRLLKKASYSYFKRFLTDVRKLHPNLKLSPLDLSEVFLGSPFQGIDRCNFDSSLGSDKEHGKTRKDLFEEIEEDAEGNVVKYRLKKEFLDDYQVFHDCVMDNILPAMKVTGCVKDEIRELKKVLKAKLRLFYLIDVYWNIFSKQYVGPIRNLMLLFPEFSKCFAKINSSSSMWDDLAKYLKFYRKGFKLFDMDFEKFDTSHRLILNEIAEGFYFLGKEFYINEKAAAACYFCIFILGAQLFTVNQDVALKFFGLPSGFDLTLIINSIANAILLIYAFLILVSSDADEFFEKVFPATVGDDNLSAVDEEIADRFNTVTIAPIYRQFCYRVTNGDKSEELKPFISRDKAVFVKRGFYFCPINKVYLAPLATDSLFKALSFSDNSGKNISETDRLAQVVDMVHREFFFHGKNTFEGETLFLRKLVRVNRIKVQFFTYDELRTKFKAKEFTMNWI